MPCNCQHTPETLRYKYPTFVCVNNRVHISPLHWTQIDVIVAASMDTDLRYKIPFLTKLKKKPTILRAKSLERRLPPLPPLFRHLRWYFMKYLDLTMISANNFGWVSENYHTIYLNLKIDKRSDSISSVSQNYR